MKYLLIHSVIIQSACDIHPFHAFLCKILLKCASFAHFPRGAWGEFYKSWHKSNKLQSFRLILPIVNLLYNICQGTLKSLKKRTILTLMRRKAAQQLTMTLKITSTQVVETSITTNNNLSQETPTRTINQNTSVTYHLQTLDIARCC